MSIPIIRNRHNLIIKKLNFLISLVIVSVLGLISGIVGIGGGIFLSPILFLLKAEKPKIIVTTASLFILVNSISGVFGQLTKENILTEIDAVVIVTGHDEFKQIEINSFRKIKSKILIDSRGIIDPNKIKNKNLIFRGLGRGDF